MGMNWPEIGYLMKVSTMLYIYDRYCVFTWYGRNWNKFFPLLHETAIYSSMQSVFENKHHAAGQYYLVSTFVGVLHAWHVPLTSASDYVLNIPLHKLCWYHPRISLPLIFIINWTTLICRILFLKLSQLENQLICVPSNFFSNILCTMQLIALSKFTKLRKKTVRSTVYSQ